MLKQIFASLRLRVSWILDLDPVRLSRFGVVNSGTVFRYDSFEIVGACQSEQVLPVFRHIIEIPKSGSLPASDDLPQDSFSFFKRMPTQVGSVHPEHVECDKEKLAAPKHQVFKLRTTMFIKRHNLAIENSVFAFEFRR